MGLACCRPALAVERRHIPKTDWSSQRPKELKESLRSGGEEGLSSPMHRHEEAPVPDSDYPHEYGKFNVTVGENTIGEMK